MGDPPAKKQKIDGPPTSRDHVLLPYRAVGSVTGPVPPAVITAGKDSFALCAVGKTLHEYNLAKLQLINVSQALPKKIRAVAKQGVINVAAAKGEIYCFKIRRLLWSGVHSKHAKVTQMIARNQVLISLGTDGTVKVWRLENGEELAQFTLRHDATPTVMTTVVNYGTKVVVGTAQGHLELWNFNSGELVHKFPSFGAQVTALSASPADDTIGVGLGNGKVLLYNLAYGKTLFEFRHAKHGGRDPVVTSISFRADGPQTMCSGTEFGEVAVWNLAKKRLEGLLTANLQAASQDEVFEPPHTGRVTLLHFLPAEPVLFSAGEDNSLRMYVFDKLQGTGKLLRERRGHTMSCTGASFFDSKLILSHGLDKTLRASHVFTDLFNREVSQGSLVKEAKKRGVMSMDLKLPPITSIAMSTRRTHDWSSVVTGHKNSGVARLWRMDKFAVSEHRKGLTSPNEKDKGKVVSAVQISQCGNYALIGYSSGRLHCFNLQSGEYRGSFGDEGLEGNRAHDGRVVGIFFLQDNGMVLTVGADCYQRLWRFPPKVGDDGAAGEPALKFKFAMEVVPDVAAFNPSNNFVAVGSGDYGVRVYDVTPKHAEISAQDVIDTMLRKATVTTKTFAARLVRHFKKHQTAVTSISFTPDSRLLLSSSLDGVMCVWDMPTDRLIDAISFPSPITSLAVHPEGYFVSTTHSNDENVYLWTNKMKYGHIPSVFTEGAEIEPFGVFKMPEVTIDGTWVDGEEGDHEEVGLEDAYTADTDAINTKMELTDIEKKLVELVEGDQEGVISMSPTPKGKWATLVALDEIKKRNAPIAPPKKIDAPFFLPSLGNENQQQQQQPESRVMSSLKADSGAGLDLSQETPFLRLLKAKDFSGALVLLEGLGVSKVDTEFKSLIDTFFGIDDPDGTGEDRLSDTTKAHLNLVIDFFMYHLPRKTHYDFVQALLATFLKYAGLQAAANPELKSRLSDIHTMQQQNAALLSSLCDSALASVRHFVGGV